MQDLVDATFEAPKSEQVGEDAENDPLSELLLLLGLSNTATAENSPGHASIAITRPQSASGAGRDERWMRRGRETTYPYGDPLAAADFVPPRRHSDEQSSQSAPNSPAAARPHARSAYEAKENRADDHTSSDKHPLLWRPRVPRGGVGLAIIGIAASALVGTLAGVGYYAPSPSETIGEARAIAANSAETKTTATGQHTSAEARDPQAVATSRSDEPKKVRTVSFGPDGVAAETPAAPSSTNVPPEFNVAPMPRARPNAADRPERAATGKMAAALSDPRSELHTSSLSRAGPNVEAEERARNRAVGKSRRKDP
jgi:hypothetical protein